jgi:hypothetical protein
MDDTELVIELQKKVAEAEELLRRRREALAALKGKTGAKSRRTVKGLRPGSIPAMAQVTLRTLKQPLSLDELTAQLKKTNASLDSRKVSIALSRYVRRGQHFVITDDGKYSLK